MILVVLGSAAALVVVLGGLAVGFTLWASHWGSTRDERSATMPGDAYRPDESRVRVVMTRGVTIHAPAEHVWPWLAQLGRGAGWYTYDRLDNGGKTSARHIVSWIPQPREGDSSPIGHIRRVTPGAALTWAVDDTPFLGSMTGLVTDIRLVPQGDGSRLVIRMSADAIGGWPRLTLSLFRFIDSIMARRQLIGLRERAERFGARSADPDNPETGARDQYQFYEVIYRSGDRAGTPGKEQAEVCRRAAVAAGLTDLA